MIDALSRELDGWQALGLRASFWWRDDDACSDTPALRHLLGLAHDCALPLALAAIPARADATLAAAVDAASARTFAAWDFASDGATRTAELLRELLSTRGARAKSAA